MLDASESIVRLVMRNDDRKPLGVGTGVLYRHNEKHYIVTAWHNLTGRHNFDYSCIDPSGAAPTNVLVLMARRVTGYITSRLAFEVRLEDEETTKYFVHPQMWPRIDVAALPIHLDQSYSHEMNLSTGRTRIVNMPLLLDTHGFGTQKITTVQDVEVDDPSVVEAWFENLDVTDELFIPGYPEGITDYLGQPVWKRATVASRVTPGWNNESKFLIDCASRNGMSGAPVFYHNREGRVKIGNSSINYPKIASILAGIYIGRVGTTDEFEAQVGVVWHRKVIDEMLNAETLGFHSQEMYAGDEQIIEALKACYKNSAKQGLQNVMDENLPARYYVLNEVMVKIDGRASRKILLDEILALTKTMLDSGEYEDAHAESN